MGLFSENTSLLYLSILIIPVLSIVISRQSVSFPKLFSFSGSTQFGIAAGISLFCGTAFSVLLTIMPYINNSLLAIGISFSLIAVLLALAFNSTRISTAAVSFIDGVSPLLRIVTSAVVVIFFAVIHTTALIYIGSLLAGYFFEGSLYLFVVINVIVAGFVVLMGDRMTLLVNNAMLGFLSLLTLLALVIIPDATFLLEKILAETLKAQPESFFAGTNDVFFPFYAPIGISLLSWWIWWIDHYMPHRQWSEEKDMVMNSVTTFFLIVTIAALLLILTWSLRRADVPFIVNESPAVAFPVFFLFSFLFLGSLFRSFSIVKMFSFQISVWLSTEGLVREKDILVSRLVVAAFAIISILLFPVAEIFGARIIALNLITIACFIVPIISVFFLFTFWRRLAGGGISAGILSGLFLGIAMFVAAVPATFANTPSIFDPVLMSVISFAVTAVSAVAATLFFEKKEQRWKKLRLVSANDNINKVS